MSVIAVKIDTNKITIAADSIIIKEDLKRTNFTKLHKFDNIIVGGCGGAEELSMFFDFVNENKDTLKDAKNTTSIRKFIKSFSDYKEEFTKDYEVKNSYIIIVNNYVFETEGMLVQEVKEFTAIGQGDAYALSALALGHTVEESVKVACDLCCFVSEPIVTYTISVHR